MRPPGGRAYRPPCGDPRTWPPHLARGRRGWCATSTPVGAVSAMRGARPEAPSCLDKRARARLEWWRRRAEAESRGGLEERRPRGGGRGGGGRRRTDGVERECERCGGWTSRWLAAVAGPVHARRGSIGQRESRGRAAVGLVPAVRSEEGEAPPPTREEHRSSVKAVRLASSFHAVRALPRSVQVEAIPLVEHQHWRCTSRGIARCDSLGRRAGVLCLSACATLPVGKIARSARAPCSTLSPEKCLQQTVSTGSLPRLQGGRRGRVKPRDERDSGLGALA